MLSVDDWSEGRGILLTLARIRAGCTGKTRRYGIGCFRLHIILLLCFMHISYFIGLSNSPIILPYLANPNTIVLVGLFMILRNFKERTKYLTNKDIRSFYLS